MQNDQKAALLLIDIQKGFNDIEYWGGNRNNPEAEKNARTLLNYWRKNGLPLFHIKHCSTNPESRVAPSHPGNEIKDEVKPLKGETVIEKNVNSAFIGTDLKQKLDRAGIQTLVIVGLTTDHCVSTTARMAGNYGYETFLVSDATATFDKVGPNGKTYTAEMIHDVELASLHTEFVTVVNTKELLEKMNLLK